MNADCTFQIGKNHTVCEDYAIAGKLGNRLSYAIVCDGCSASTNVDFGARVIALAARETLQYKLCLEDELFENVNPNLNPNRFGDLTIRKAQNVLHHFNQLNQHALDATLLVAWVQNNQATVYMYGDGIFIHRMSNGIHTVHIHLTSGAPDYLSYQLDKDRLAAYNALPDNNKIVEVHNVSKVSATLPQLKPLEPYAITVSVKEGEIISVISDGLNSFRKSDNNPIMWTDLIEEFTGYKTTEGEFVQRRISAFKRKCVKENWYHLDDISIACIVI